MAADTGQGPILMMKKLGAMASLILGAALAAFGYSSESTGTIVVGVVFLALGAILLALKIIRRNQDSQVG
jgi:hypothetical protein